MKLFFKLCFIFILCSVLCIKSEALNFEEGYNELSQTPMAVLLYAPWVDNISEYSEIFKSAQTKFSSKCNFVELNIADKDAKFFNEKYNIYQNLPYVLFFKNERNVRFLSKDCVSDLNCLNQRLTIFLQ